MGRSNGQVEVETATHDPHDESALVRLALRALTPIDSMVVRRMARARRVALTDAAAAGRIRYRALAHTARQPCPILLTMKGSGTRARRSEMPAKKKQKQAATTGKPVKVKKKKTSRGK
jgi:hypothetical protein